MRFARTKKELEQIFRLRYRVFNLELEEGLDASHATGLDEDAYDAQCHHLSVLDDSSGQCVGTYRLQTYEMASLGIGFYSAAEFDLSTMPDEILVQSVEAGRACIDAGHRTIRVLHLLWRGLGIYLSYTRKRFLFGCCSLTSQVPEEGIAVLGHLRKTGKIMDGWSVSPRSGYACESSHSAAIDSIGVKIPRLMKAYLAQGAAICGPPAIDREFKTIDFLALFDSGNLSRDSKSYYGLEQ